MDGEIQLLQFFICKEFRQEKQDHFTAELIHSNLTAPKFPFRLGKVYAVTCWRKDQRFHKEVIEYRTAYGASCRSPHMDVEPVTDSVLFRWHKHVFPRNFAIEKPTILTVRVLLDGRAVFESYLLIEKSPYK